MSQRLIGNELRIEVPKNISGLLKSETRIPVLKTENYKVLPSLLDGEAPKQFIKAYIYQPNSTVRRDSPRTWHKYIAKTAEKWYPHESVIEYMINKIGHVIGLEMNQVFLVRANSQIRFLSKYFLKYEERLTHGAEICGDHLRDHTFAKEVAQDKKNARELFTFEFIEKSIKNVYPEQFEVLMKSLVKMLIFDAIVGNNDRHFYNWGVIEKDKGTTRNVRFAPIYDSARGLLWNMDDDNIKRILSVHNSGGSQLFNYIKKASPRISIESNSDANHFELLAFIVCNRRQYHGLVTEMSSHTLEKRVLNYLQINFAPFFCKERNEIITFTLKQRFSEVRKLLV